QPLGVRRLISSSYARCTQTLEPLAEELGLKVEVDDRLAEGAGLQALEVVREAGDRAALSTHGDICSDLLEFLARQGVVRGALQAEKGSTWVLELEGSRIVAARYLPAPGGAVRRPGSRRCSSGSARRPRGLAASAEAAGC